MATTMTCGQCFQRKETTEGPSAAPQLDYGPTVRLCGECLASRRRHDPEWYAAGWGSVLSPRAWRQKLDQGKPVHISEALDCAGLLPEET